MSHYNRFIPYAFCGLIGLVLIGIANPSKNIRNVSLMNAILVNDSNYVASYVLKDENNLETARFIGSYWLDLGNYDKASPWLEKAAVQGNFLAQYNLGMLRLHQGRIDEAMQAFIAANCYCFNQINNQATSLLSSDSSAAISIFDTYIRYFPQNSQALYRLADVSSSIGDTEKAIASLEQALVFDPDRSERYQYQSARLAYLQKNYPAALSVLAELTVQSPDYFSGWYLMGQVLIVDGKYAEAETALRRALELDPTVQYIHSYLATALANQSKNDEAIVELWAVYRETPGDLRYLTRLRDLYAKIDQTCMENALSEWVSDTTRKADASVEKLVRMACNVQAP